MTPSEIIDPVGARAQAPARPRAAEERGWASRHPVLAGFLILVVGFGFMHLIFVGGPQRRPLLPFAPPAQVTGVASGTPQTSVGAAKRAHTQPYDVTATGTVG